MQHPPHPPRHPPPIDILMSKGTLYWWLTPETSLATCGNQTEAWQLLFVSFRPPQWTQNVTPTATFQRKKSSRHQQQRERKKCNEAKIGAALLFFEVLQKVRHVGWRSTLKESATTSSIWCRISAPADKTVKADSIQLKIHSANSFLICWAPLRLKTCSINCCRNFNRLIILAENQVLKFITRSGSLEWQ